MATQLQKTKTACSTSTNGGFNLLKENIDHWSNHGDWEPLAYQLMNHREKSIHRRICGYVFDDHVKFVTGKDAKGSKWGGVIQYDKKANSIMRLEERDGEMVPGFYMDLQTLINGKYGVNGKVKVKTADGEKNVVAHTHMFPSVKVDDRTKKQKLEARVKSDLKWLSDNKLKAEAYIAMLQEAIKK